MHQLSHCYRQHPPPAPHDRRRVRDALDAWRAAACDAGLETDSDPETEATLAAIFGNSPFLTGCILRDPTFAADLLGSPPDVVLERIFENLAQTAPHLQATPALMRVLRIARQRIALTTALADVMGVWDLEAVTGALSRFAEAALGYACAHLLRQRAEAGDITLGPAADAPAPTPEAIMAGSGLIVLGMGKLGAGELNYSSDIDLIVLYDPEVARHGTRRASQAAFIRLARDLVRILQERTGDGYVFRVDLRLRPDPGATPVALSTDAAEIYYQSVGLNWERAAMIKARPVAGDIAAGTDFLERIAPFVWRRHLDYAALEDIHAIRLQIESFHHQRDIALPGHDLKLGRGGIREIEFFAQTQQLIVGGRDPSVREPTTLGALAALCAAGWIDTDVRDELSAAYRYLRRLEHRLQMINDEQTHTIPTRPDDIARLAAFAGAPSAAALEVELLGHLRRVHRRYQDLFEDSAVRAAGPALTITSGPDTAEQIRALGDLGYADAERALATVKAWQHGRYRACRSDRARRLLGDLTPAILKALGASADADGALARFDEFLSRLPSGVQLFSLFHAHPWLLELLSEILGGAPRLADALSRAPGLLDAVLGPDFFAPPPGPETLEQSLDEALAPARDYQDLLDLARRWCNELKFRIGVLVLRNVIDGLAAGRAQSDIADALIRALLPRVADEFARQHGRIEGAGLAVVALGKLGGRELTPTSDLDLVFIYEARDDDAVSGGARPLPVSQYFARLSQRLIAALTALTAEGRLYQVDMRLRPSGRAGPIAVSLDRFETYHRDHAWTWEHMALTRSRPVAGPPALCTRIDRITRAVLTRPRDPDELRADVAEMRTRLEAEFPTTNPWDIKHVRGGLLDLEFIAQYLVLRHAADARRVLCPTTAEVFSRLAAAGLMPEMEAREFRAATEFQQNIQQFLRLCFEGPFTEDSAPAGLKRALAAAAGCSGFDALKRRLLETQDWVRGRYAKYLETP